MGFKVSIEQEIYKKNTKIKTFRNNVIMSI
jgi:hypothetical protein